LDTPVERTILAAGRHLQLVQQGHWEYADRTSAREAVALAAVTDERQLLLVEQYRIPVGRRVIELPAGLVGDIAGEEDERLETAAGRELLEETGYRASRLELLTSGPPSAGMASEIVAFFLASGLVKVHDGGGDEAEDITVHAVPLASVENWLDQQAAAGLLIDPKIYAGLYFIRQR
jgi:ADP-ribose pyrophosphatase